LKKKKIELGDKYNFEHANKYASEKRKITYRIDVGVQHVAIIIFHVLPDEEHTITWPGLFWDFRKSLRPQAKIREFCRTNLLECST
jgi:hypothetical protein